MSLSSLTTESRPQHYRLQGHPVVCDPVLYRDFEVLCESRKEKDFCLSRTSTKCSQSVNDSLDTLQLESAVYLRTADRCLLGFNAASRHQHGLETPMLGKRLRNLPAGSSRHLDESTEQALLAGANLLCFEHDAQAADGRTYRWWTMKTRFLVRDDVDICLATLSRPVAVLSAAAAMPCRLLSEQLLMYRQLEETDRRICQGIALGDLTEQIADSVGLTRRSVEVRRGKILEHFGFSRKVQIVRLMVRLEENGLMPD